MLVGIAIWYFALRDTGSACQRIVGTPAEIEHLTGQRGKLAFHWSDKYSCSQTYEDAARHTLITLDYEDQGYTTAPDGSRFARVEHVTVTKHEAKIFVATDAKETTADEIYADATRRAVGPSRLGKDPMGEALAALPETRHVVIMRLGSKDLRMTFDRRISLDQMKAYLGAVVARL